jgi:hypothetical protein
MSYLLIVCYSPVDLSDTLEGGQIVSCTGDIADSTDVILIVTDK